MKNQKTQSKIIVAMSAVILLLVALSATLTFAWFTATTTATNEASTTFGEMSFAPTALVISDGDSVGQKHIEALANSPIVPGCTLDLAGGLAINTNINAFVRMKMTVDLGRMDQGVWVSTEKANAVAADADNDSVAQRILRKLLTANQVQDTNNAKISGVANWLANSAEGDDWLYFDKKVTADTDLLDFADASIELDGALITNTYQGLTLKISIDAQAIQADHISYGVTPTVVADSITGVSVEAANNKITVANLASIFEASGFFGA